MKWWCPGPAFHHYHLQPDAIFNNSEMAAFWHRVLNTQPNNAVLWMCGFCPSVESTTLIRQTFAYKRKMLHLTNTCMHTHINVHTNTPVYTTTQKHTHMHTNIYTNTYENTHTHTARHLSAQPSRIMTFSTVTMVSVQPPDFTREWPQGHRVVIFHQPWKNFFRVSVT